jgi:hypothetical protein
MLRHKRPLRTWYDFKLENLAEPPQPNNEDGR